MSQSSRNSSRPPSSDLPWDKSTDHQKNNEEQTEPDQESETPAKKTEAKEDTLSPSPSKQDSDRPLRKQGKQAGTQGFGRTQKIAVTDVQHHYPSSCTCCGTPLNTDSAIAYTAFETLDIEWADIKRPGIYLTNTQHTLYSMFQF